MPWSLFRTNKYWMHRNVADLMLVLAKKRMPFGGLELVDWKSERVEERILLN